MLDKTLEYVILITGLLGLLTQFYMYKMVKEETKIGKNKIKAIIAMLSELIDS